MHELGITQNILDIVRQAVPTEQAADIRKIKLRIGPLAGIVTDSLDSCFAALVDDTDMAQAALEIEKTPLVALCRDCQKEFEVKQFAFCCPSCDSGNVELVHGTELEVAEIEITDRKDESS